MLREQNPEEALLSTARAAFKAMTVSARNADIDYMVADLISRWTVELAKVLAGVTAKREGAAVAVVREPIDEDETAVDMFWREGAE